MHIETLNFQLRIDEIAERISFRVIRIYADVRRDLGQQMVPDNHHFLFAQVYYVMARRMTGSPAKFELPIPDLQNITVLDWMIRFGHRIVHLRSHPRRAHPDRIELLNRKPMLEKK